MAKTTAKKPTTSKVSTTPSSASSGVPKWAIILVVVLLAFLGIFLVSGYIVGKKISQKMRESGVSINQDGKGGFMYQSEKGDVKMQAGDNVTLPASFPKSVPLYAGYKLASSVSSNEGLSITYVLKGVPASTVDAFYKSELPKNGWTIRPTGGDGFISFNNDTMHGIMTVFSKDDATSVIINMSEGKE